MAFSFGNGGLGNRRFRGSESMSEMNVVPLVDVVLVLLIIFMLAANVMEFGLEIEVPVVRQVESSTQELPVVSITRNGELYLNESPVNINELGTVIEQQFGEQQAVYVRADRNTIWDVVAQVIEVLGSAGMNVQAVTRPLDDTGQ